MGRCSSSSQGNHSFSMLFSVPNGTVYEHYDPFLSSSSPSSSSSSSVDCTLSLGTPSTHLSEEDEGRRLSLASSYNVSGFGWDFLHTNGRMDPYGSQLHGNPGRGSGKAPNGGDPLLARRCANCDTTSTPLWRNGPRGPKTLCNACGIRFKKEERRSAAAKATAGGGHEQSHCVGCYSPAASEFRFVEEVCNGDFLSWRLTVAEGPGLVHDFTA